MNDVFLLKWQKIAPSAAGERKFVIYLMSPMYIASPNEKNL